MSLSLKDITNGTVHSKFEYLESQLKCPRSPYIKNVSLCFSLPVSEVTNSCVLDLINILKRTNRCNTIEELTMTIHGGKFEERDVITILNEFSSPECKFCGMSFTIVIKPSLNIICFVTQEICFKFSNEGALKTISFGGIMISDSILNSLCNTFPTSSHSKGLRLINSRLGSGDFKLFMSVVSTRMSLTHLSFSYVNLRTKADNNLVLTLACAISSKENTFQELILHGNNFTDDDSQKILLACTSNPTLKCLVFHNNKIGTKGTRALDFCMRRNKVLTKLSLEYNEIASEDAKTIALAMQANDTLEVLSLTYNKISDEVALELEYTLAVNKSLKELELDHNWITDEGARSLASGIAVNTCLTTINLSNNMITDIGVDKIVDALAVNKTLMNLKLQHNIIGDQGFVSLLHVLKTNCTLRSLTLDSDHFSNMINQMEELSEALEYNDTMNCICFDDHREIDERLRKMLTMNRKNIRFAKRKVYSWLLSEWANEES